MPHRRRAVAVLAAALALLAGCGPGQIPGGHMDPMAELAARPTLEQVLNTYQEMQRRVFDRLSAEFGPFGWHQVGEGFDTACGEDFPPNSPGSSQIMPSWGFEGAISDAQWPRAVRIIAEVTSEYGFAAPKTLADRAGQHDISGVDQYGGHYRFGTQINTSWRVSSGCHLPAAERR